MSHGIEDWFERQQAAKQNRLDKCQNKRAFSSEAEARAHAAADRAQFGDRFTPYQCDLCGDWHLTRSDS